jgi:hypothetical protein
MGHESAAGAADASTMSAAGQAQGFPDYIIVPPDAPSPASAPTAPTAAAAAPAPRERSPALPLLALVIGLAGAAIWFVGLPQLDKPAPVQRSCEVIVLESGKTRCVKNPAAAKAQKAKQAGRAKK